ncbi:Adaptin N terminal region family protein [Tritrichomonas foetus]|uniref:Adaptin N terminal region family protein n=1 Tax=Tritrichomonas foetus TaxID=1144522 RepID=A0A1J4J746_9EUKA|nr:Adaptin N terminal region family protein [Tritrichomonas foetus]|eukprot:OHS95058.1 Adaptin N terminal region family protein [Tritrichomonas foetus]
MDDSLEIDAKEEIPVLRNSLDSNNASLRQKAVKRVLALVRIGETSVSSLFTSMLRCVHTEDIQLKKLIYIYLVNFATSEPEQAIMAVNCFIKDSENPNPIIRALAVRTMCRIKLETVAEYMVLPLKKSLSDENPYVRKTAALAVAKIYSVIPETVETAGILTKLLTLISDENPMVISNAATALFEINDMRTTPIFVLNEVNVSPILSSIGNCSEWIQIQLLDILGHYSPATDQEATFLIDRLIPLMKSSNPAVVVGAFRCVFTFMDNDKRNHGEIFKMMLPPLITLIGKADSEVCFVILKMISLFVTKYPKSLQNNVRLFFCRYFDSCYIKIEKLNIIVALTSPMNVTLVIAELEEYVNDADILFVRKTIESLGKLALKLSVASRRIVEVLVKIVESKTSDYAIQESIIVFCDILRSFPGEFESIIGKLLNCYEIISSDPRAKAAAVWMIGEFCDIVEKPDLIIDPFLDNFKEEPTEVQIQILTSVVKIYLNYGDSNKDQLQFILEEATKSDTVLPDVKNRALIYWRLLTIDKESAKEIIIRRNILTNQNIQNNNNKCSWDFGQNEFDETVFEVLMQNSGKVSNVFRILPEDFIQSQLFKPEIENNDLFSQNDANFSNSFTNNTAKENNGILGSHHELNLRNWRKAIIENDNNIIDIFIDMEDFSLFLKVVCKTSSQKFDSFAVAIDRNVLGLGLSNPPTFPVSLEFGESFETRIQLAYNASLVLNEGTHTYLRGALRISSEKTVIFSAPIDITSFTSHFEYEFGRPQYDSMWSELPELDVTIVENRIAEKAVLSGRGILTIDDETNFESAKRFVFMLPGDLVYLAKAEEVMNEYGTKNVNVQIRGNQTLFSLLKENATLMFCNEDKLIL